MVRTLTFWKLKAGVSSPTYRSSSSGYRTAPSTQRSSISSPVRSQRAFSSGEGNRFRSSGGSTSGFRSSSSSSRSSGSSRSSFGGGRSSFGGGRRR